MARRREGRLLLRALVHTRPPRGCHRYPGAVPLTLPPLSRARARAAAAYPTRQLLTKRASGTNGWLSSWGTNAHGEIAGCPPPRG